MAAKDAGASGYWSVVTRPDGVRQWAYRNFPLYTYVDDKNPGDANGNDTYQYVMGDDAFVSADVGLKGARGFFWHTAVP